MGVHLYGHILQISLFLPRTRAWEWSYGYKNNVLCHTDFSAAGMMLRGSPPCLHSKKNGKACRRSHLQISLTMKRRATRMLLLWRLQSAEIIMGTRKPFKIPRWWIKLWPIDSVRNTLHCCIKTLQEISIIKYPCRQVHFSFGLHSKTSEVSID